MNRLIRKPLLLCAVIALTSSGCQSGKDCSASPAWRRVTGVGRADGGNGDASRAYADTLHKSLKGANIEHKVVTFSYGWDSNLDHVRRTVVIYRDNSNVKYPWWAMDQHLEKPVWLSNEVTTRQVQFLARRPASVVDEKFYPAVPEGKNVRPAEKHHRIAAVLKSHPSEKSARREPVTTIQPPDATPNAKTAEPPVPAAVKAEPRTQSAPPKSALIGKETPEDSTPKATIIPSDPPVAKPAADVSKPPQIAPPIAPPANVKEPKPIVPKPVPKLRTRPSELDVPKSPSSSRRRGLFDWIFVRLESAP